MYKHILLPTDGSDRSGRAISAGLTLAKMLNARVTGLFVGAPTYIHEIDDGSKPLADAALAEIARTAATLGVECECVCVAHERPQDGIVDYAREHSCDLILMATRGRSRVGKLLLGSTAASILADCDIPVLLYR